MPDEANASPLRRSSRINIRIPVRIFGKRADHQEFSEETFILTVSKFGARLKTVQPLKIGMQLNLQPKGRRDVARFRVVWIGRPDSPRAGEVGIEYITVSNLLGVAFPD
ncbi:MAG: hypothetical protein ABSG54_07840 [Terriglobia bacterium]|jgi:hypothetical protein